MLVVTDKDQIIVVEVEVAYAPGTLPANGVHGSMSPQDPVGDDTKITEFPDYGGRTIKCTRGIYYRDQGFSACEDVGNVKFRFRMELKY